MCETNDKLKIIKGDNQTEKELVKLIFQPEPTDKAKYKELNANLKKAKLEVVKT